MIDPIQVSIETAINNGYPPAEDVIKPPAEDVIKNLFSTSGKCGIIFVSLASKRKNVKLATKTAGKM